jgi:hypothetical protein
MNFVILILVWVGWLNQNNTAGQQFDLTDALQLDRDAGQFARLFVPDHIDIFSDSEIDLVLHLHGASWTAERAVIKTRIPAILVSVHLAGFSSVYRRYFEIPGRVDQIIAAVRAILREQNEVQDIRIRRLILTSFSAGYGGVRELLKFPELYHDIDALLLADGLHTDSDSLRMAEQMSGFVRFAADASRSEKVMVVTHSRIEPEGYESTTSTADYLLRELGLARDYIARADSIGQQYTHTDAGYFHVSGYLGQTGSDHMRHLRHMDIPLKILMDDLQAADSNSR